MERRRKRLRWAILLGALALLGAGGIWLCAAFGDELLTIFEDPAAMRAWFDRFGGYDEAVFVLIRAAQTCVKFIPAEPLELGSGYLWGAGWGMVWCLLGNVLGSCVILLLTRRFGQKLVDRVLPQKAVGWLDALQRSRHLYGVLTLIYLIPGTPKDGLVYLAGLMKIDLRAFMAINIVGRIPSILSSTLCGAALGEQQYGLSAAVFVATLLLGLAGGLFYRRWANRPAECTKEGD